MAEKKGVKFLRDEKGKLMRIEFSADVPLSADAVYTVGLMAGFIEEVRISVQKFDTDTQKYSKRMEKLTIAMLALAIVQIVTSIASIATLLLH